MSLSQYWYYTIIMLSTIYSVSFAAGSCFSFCNLFAQWKATGGVHQVVISVDLSYRDTREVRHLLKKSPIWIWASKTSEITVWLFRAAELFSKISQFKNSICLLLNPLHTQMCTTSCNPIKLMITTVYTLTEGDTTSYLSHIHLHLVMCRFLIHYHHQPSIKSENW